MRSTQIIFAVATVLLALSVMVQIMGIGGQPLPVSKVDGGGQTAQAPIEYRVVGFTNATNGDIRTTDATGAELRGYKAMHRLCEVEVAPNARAAFSTEYLRSPLPAEITKAWLIPKKPKRLWRPNGVGFWVAYDAGVGRFVTPPYTYPQTSRADAKGALSCTGFTSASPLATGAAAGPVVVQPRQPPPVFPVSVTLASCSVQLPVPCVAPVAIPVTP